MLTSGLLDFRLSRSVAKIKLPRAVPLWSTSCESHFGDFACVDLRLNFSFAPVMSIPAVGCDRAGNFGCLDLALLLQDLART